MANQTDQPNGSDNRQRLWNALRRHTSHSKLQRAAVWAAIVATHPFWGLMPQGLRRRANDKWPYRIGWEALFATQAQEAQEHQQTDIKK